jgi:hypothetical protein
MRSGGTQMMYRIRTLLFATAMLIAGPALFVGGCGDDEASNSSGPGSGGGGGGGAGTPGEGICLLNNCSADDHCLGCPDGRTSCLVSENRCVACDPNTGAGCAAGEECSPFGICVPQGLTCPSDNGSPTVTCSQNSDCLACSPMHQVCDTVTAKCQACIETNTQHCLSSDICIDTDADGRVETCSPKCPATCSVDNDCGQCGGPGNEAHACFQHKCAECSDTFPCAAGLECLNGVCTPPCGIIGAEAGTCTQDEDCNFCGDAEMPGTWNCKTPINDPSHGVCGPPANGCSDLGNGVAVLPAPYNQVTELCSTDADCVQAGAGITFNVGKFLRDKVIGGPEIDLGFTKVAVSDANVQYPMPICADVDITSNISCGVCVPCKVDGDCMAINVDNLLVDLFAGEPLAQIAGALLVDLLWGDQPEHNLNFFCQPVAAGYGACIPCGNPLQPCGTGGGGGGSGMCDHDVCSQGGPLDPSCSQCSADVCAADAFCCGDSMGTWDSLCVGQVDALCNNICSGPAGCPHDPCTVGAALPDNCSSCVGAICADDSFCCNSTWDSLCVSHQADAQYAAQCASACGGGCAHGECEEGAALDNMCSPCATAICGADSFCCDTLWDSLCVSDAQQSASCTCN